MECMMAYAGNDLMNMVVRRVYAEHRDRFKGNGTISNPFSIDYSYDVTQAPVAKLVTNIATHNLEIGLKVTIIAQGGAINFNETLDMKATGKFVISQGLLSLSGINITTTSTNVPAVLVTAVLNTQVMPKISGALANIPVPQLTNLFGTSLSASLRSGLVINGPALEVGARITGKTRIAAADAPSPANITSLNNSAATDAMVIGMVSSSATNVLLKAILPPLSYAFDERASKAGFGAGIKGTIKATTPTLTVNGGNGKITTTVSFSGFKAGIDTPVSQWKWVSLSIPKATVVIKHTLKATDHMGVITLTEVESIKTALSWPSILKPVENLVEKLLDGILSLFRGRISNAVKNKSFRLFELPSTIPGTNLAAQLSFNASNGLGYYKSSVQALVRVQGS
jgi:hypothetical protein